jgi:hypothetical protein
MICECCKKKMLEGYVPESGIWWMPKSGEHALGRQVFCQEQKELETDDKKGTKKHTAYYCVDCDRIVIDCKGAFNQRSFS